MFNFLRISKYTDELFKKFVEKELNLNDQLAAIRSILANERTFLAYQRTALATLVAGASIVQFFEIIIFIVLGWILIAASFITFFIGVIRYRRTRRNILQLEKDFVRRNETID